MLCLMSPVIGKPWLGVPYVLFLQIIFYAYTNMSQYMLIKIVGKYTLLQLSFSTSWYNLDSFPCQFIKKICKDCMIMHCTHTNTHTHMDIFELLWKYLFICYLFFNLQNEVFITLMTFLHLRNIIKLSNTILYILFHYMCRCK
jgi:hypothetical protein